AVLAQLSPAGVALPHGGFFVFAVLGAAWFGGAGPGFVAALLATFALPHLIEMSYPLLGGFFDLPRFLTFSVARLAVGWSSVRRRQYEAALRDSEDRPARAVEGSGAGHWDWNMVTDELFVSERAREMFSLPVGPLPRTRAEFVGLLPPEVRASMKDEMDAAMR